MYKNGKYHWITLLISIGLFLLVYVFLCYLLMLLFIYISFLLLFFCLLLFYLFSFVKSYSLTCFMFAVLRVSPFSPSSCFFFVFFGRGGGRGGWRTARYKDLNIVSQER